MLLLGIKNSIEYNTKVSVSILIVKNQAKIPSMKRPPQKKKIAERREMGSVHDDIDECGEETQNEEQSTITKERRHLKSGEAQTAK